MSIKPEPVYLPVNGGDVTAFAINNTRDRVLLAVHDRDDGPLVTARLTSDEALQLAAWLQHYARGAS